jgi:hypothetical protein
VVEHFQRWASNSQVRDWICQAWVKPEERERRLREIFGLEPRTPEAGATDGWESNAGGRIKVNQTKSNRNENGSLCF